ncbi:MAG: hypothetical protein OHK0046_23230 [Anaerolineae bacterium]
MTKLQQMMDEINHENGYGVFLMAQMDAVPDTLQFVVATTEYDSQVDGLRDKRRYLVRCIGVQEHRLSIGMFRSLTLTTDHPLLYETNSLPAGLFFRGQPSDVHALIVDLFQGYASTFGPWRHLPTYLNTNQPLHDLLSSGGGLLGEMPSELAERWEKVLTAHHLEAKVLIGQQPEGTPTVKALLLDDSYVVALDFSVDELGKA